MGRAILTTDVPGCRDVAVSGKNGLLVPAHNPQELAKAMLQLIEQPEVTVEMGRQGRLIAEKELDARKAADLILKEMKLI